MDLSKVRLSFVAEIKDLGFVYDIPMADWLPLSVQDKPKIGKPLSGRGVAQLFLGNPNLLNDGTFYGVLSEGIVYRPGENPIIIKDSPILEFEGKYGDWDYEKPSFPLRSLVPVKESSFELSERQDFSISLNDLSETELGKFLYGEFVGDYVGLLQSHGLENIIFRLKNNSFVDNQKTPFLDVIYFCPIGLMSQTKSFDINLFSIFGCGGGHTLPISRDSPFEN